MYTYIYVWRETICYSFATNSNRFRAIPIFVFCNIAAKVGLWGWIRNGADIQNTFGNCRTVVYFYFRFSSLDGRR